MPLLDHFRPPVSDSIQWNSFHAVWASSIADQLVERIPKQFVAHEHFKLGGGLEIDIATLNSESGTNGVVSDWHSEWQPPEAAHCEAVFPDRFEVLVYRLLGGRQLVAAIELVSPGNKDREDARSAFTSKVASYLHEGISVIVIDVVTERRANLHNELIRLLNASSQFALPTEPTLYAAAYRPVLRNNEPEIDIWTRTFDVGDTLPTMPLRLVAEYFVPVDFEAAYQDARRRRRLL